MLKHIRTSRAAVLAIVPIAGALSLLPIQSAGAFEIDMKGYLRHAFSVNLEDQREVRDGLGKDTKGTLSMSRTTLRLDTHLKWQETEATIIARASEEYSLRHLERLEALGAAQHSGGSLSDELSEAEIREAFLDIPISNRVFLRVGKQQLVWGETDFFVANDLIHGYDYSWRSFLEAENEELRKPLIMARLDYEVPKLNGMLQTFFRPGYDEDDAIGNTYDIFGGRWANQPNKGVDFLSLIPYDFDHSEAQADEATFGVRWSGITNGGLTYSVMAMRHHNPDPVYNSPLNPYKGEISSNAAGLGSFIFPVVETAGFTLSGYSGTLDAVLSTEVAYTWDKPYNYGRGTPILVPDASFPFGIGPSGGEGSAGIIEKDTVTTMVRIDKQLDLTGTFLNTSRPSFASLQVFHTWIPSWKESDEMVQLVGYDARRKEHTVIVTGILGLNYRNDTINPQLAIGWDATHGGGFLIPSVNFVSGDHWRLLIEADLFFADGKSKKHAADMEGSAKTRVMGYNDRNSQLYARLTYNF